MALENLQNLPGKKQQTGFGVFGQTLAVLLGITMLTCWLATQVTAHMLGYQPALGEPLARLGAYALYTPIDYFLWLLKFGNVQGTEDAFFYGEVILFALHFLFVPAVWLAVRRAKKIGGKTDLHGSARWAEKEDIYTSTLLRRPVPYLKKLAHKAIDVNKVKWMKPLLGDKPATNFGCYIGAWIDPKTGEYHYLAHDGPEHLLTFAPTRSGKGVGQVIPTLLSWPHSTVVHDIKGEAWALTAGYRKAKGHRVLKFEPSEPDGSSIRFNPLEEVRLRTPREVADVQNIAQMIVDPDGKGMADHWAKTGHELLSAAILHILYLGHTKTLRGLVSFFCDPARTIEQVAESMLTGQHDPHGAQGWIDLNTGEPTNTHPVVAESARSFLNKSENERSGVQSTAMSYLSLYRDPIVAANTEVSEFRIHDLMNFDDPVSLYLVVPPNDKARLRPLIRLVLNQIFRQTTEKMDFADGRSVAGYKHRLLMMLDEFPALGKLDLVQESLAFVAGYGIKCYLITQDLTQLYAAYGKDESILSNCHVRMAYAPNKVETAELLSKYCGVTTINKQTRSYSGSRLNPLLMHVMAAEQETQRPLLTADECLRLPGAVKSQDGKNILEPGDMLIFPAGSPPIYGKQILYFKDPIFDARSKIKAPLESDRLHLRVTKNIPRTHVVEPAPVVKNTTETAPTAPPVTTVPVAPAIAAAAVQYSEEELEQLNAEADDADDLDLIFTSDDEEPASPAQAPEANKESGASDLDLVP